MIDGLKIEIGSDELKAWLQQRAQHHADKASFYADQVKALESGGVERQQATNDPISSLNQSAKTHQERHAFFAFMADHLVANETYRLTESDMGRLEFVARYF